MVRSKWNRGDGLFDFCMFVVIIGICAILVGGVISYSQYNFKNCFGFDAPHKPNLEVRQLFQKPIDERMRQWAMAYDFCKSQLAVMTSKDGDLAKKAQECSNCLDNFNKAKEAAPALWDTLCLKRRISIFPPNQIQNPRMSKGGDNEQSGWTGI